MTSQVTATQKPLFGRSDSGDTTRSLDEVTASLRALMGRADGTRLRSGGTRDEQRGRVCPRGGGAPGPVKWLHAFL